MAVIQLNTPTSGAPLEQALPRFDYLLTQMEESRNKFGNHLAQSSRNSLKLFKKVWTQFAQYYRVDRWEGAPAWEERSKRFQAFDGLDTDGRNPDYRLLNAELVLVELHTGKLPDALTRAVLAVAA